MTSVDESACRAQPIKPYAKDHVPGNRKMGFPSGMFQRLKSEPALISDDGWTRPSLKGWTLSPEDALQKGPNNRDSDYIGGSAQPNLGSEWAGLGPKGRLEKATNEINRSAEYVKGQAGPTLSAGGRRWGPTGIATIDSREAVKKYGGRYNM
ncbi:uncharacterized protein A4U43_C02F20740 [Asparagus officinalis]|uniref:Uncharacterized protein n=1 Tax=Asparagus officinalis TaxID=4686 RepID=A0A5P1FKI6_ASPOF|nr:uncharacterized protein A4U43_C02F20740 [Asparagus officinalis]